MSVRSRDGKKGTLHLYKRVPVRYASVEPRKFVWVSLYTDSQSTAELKAKTVWQQMLDGWEAHLAGDTSDAETRFEAARQLAAARGFRYMGAPEVAKLPRGELLERLGVAMKAKGKDTAAVLGGAEEPEITISRALELYWSLAREKTLGKSEDQIRRWQNPRKKSIKNLIATVGDKPISRISGDDMLDFRNWWLDRLETEDLTPNSANKDLIHIGNVLKTVNKMKRLGLVLPLSDLSFKEGDKKTRPPFSDVWIRDRILAPGALDGLNDGARGIVHALVNTGCRPSEIANLTSGQIRLSDPVPHISIEPVGRTLKSQYARRMIPLVGVSLEAMQRHPDGFPRYRDKAGMSATINKYTRERGLMETPGHSLYGLQHGFEDRMLANVDDRTRRDVFGHTLDRGRCRGRGNEALPGCRRWIG